MKCHFVINVFFFIFNSERHKDINLKKMARFRKDARCVIRMRVVRIMKFTLD